MLGNFTGTTRAIASGTTNWKQAHNHKVAAQESAGPLVIYRRLCKDDATQNEIHKTDQGPVFEKIVKHYNKILAKMW